MPSLVSPPTVPLALTPLLPGALRSPGVILLGAICLAHLLLCLFQQMRCTKSPAYEWETWRETPCEPDVRRTQ
jgi:hypothetical protein